MKTQVCEGAPLRTLKVVFPNSQHQSLISYLSGSAGATRSDGSSYFYESVNGVGRASRLNENLPLTSSLVS